jgi:O-antigen/teichoic acid export membrane protein
MFIGISRIFTALTGLLFWKIATKYYSVEDIGIATALISSLGLVLTFSRFGFDETLTRFMPFRDKDSVFSTCTLMASVATIFVSLIYIYSIPILSPTLSFLESHIFIFVIFALLNSILVFTGNAFLSVRKGEYYFTQYAVNSLRIPILIPFSVFGSMGVFYSLGLGNLLSTIAASWFIFRSIKLKFKLNNSFLKETSKFSLFNYITNIFFETPLLIMPLMILNILGAEATAKYYISFSMGSIILLIPDAISRSYLIEGCHGENLKMVLIKALTLIYLLLIPAIIFIYFFGSNILGIFGKAYAETDGLLMLYALSSLFIAVLHISNSTLSIKMMIERNAELNGLRFFLIIIISYIMISKIGLLGAGYAWLITHAILCAAILVIALKERWIK